MARCAVTDLNWDSEDADLKLAQHLSRRIEKVTGLTVICDVGPNQAWKVLAVSSAGNEQWVARDARLGTAVSLLAKMMGVQQSDGESGESSQ